VTEQQVPYLCALDEAIKASAKTRLDLARALRDLIKDISFGLGMTTHLQLVPRSRKRGSIHPLPHTPSWCSA
jgi:hypothetical protein